jgi:hypothetical protein
MKLLCVVTRSEGFLHLSIDGLYLRYFYILISHLFGYSIINR